MESLVLDVEIWKDIPGYEALYQISSWGNVKSYDRYINHYSGRKILRKGKVLSLNVYSKDGYSAVVLCKEGLKKRTIIHLVVLEVFVQKKPETNYFGNHKDLNKLNNYYENLEWVSVRENTSHYFSLKSTVSGYVGVSYDNSGARKQRWAAKIFINGKNKHLGRFLNPKEAHQAYLNALKEYGIENKYADGNQS